MREAEQHPWLSRRNFLIESHLGLGALALFDLLAADSLASAPGSESLPLAPRPQQLQAKAKRCIFLFMEGGVSQMDTFEYRPALQRYAGQQMPAFSGTAGPVATLGAARNRVIPSPFRFARHGQSGRWLSELFPHLATTVDDLAFLHGIMVDSSNHAPAVYHTLTGHMIPGSASIGSWITYGLGTENQNLPGFVVLGQGVPAVGGTGIWSNGFLPAAHQGTLFRSGSAPIVDLNQRPGMSLKDQRTELDLLQWLNERHATKRMNASELEARMASYEVAFRMQTEAPELISFAKETDATRKLYGLDDPATEVFGRQCLLARRMVERGVRFVKVLHGAVKPWDQHGDLAGRLPVLCKEVDRPVTGLLKDLKSRGLLDETLVVWASEMGRTPFDSNVVSDKPGRDHNQYGLVMWMAGGEIRPGSTFGQTDDFSLRSAETPIPIRDVHATLLRLMGLDQNQLTFLHAGRYKKLTDTGGRVISEILT
ncbi:MAG: DUF1501 domain-containing protein [Acidimicrobiia bacterium]|nr:DUF1501 domain-containing protein [Acidimicrobiia bacterium]